MSDSEWEDDIGDNADGSAEAAVPVAGPKPPDSSSPVAPAATATDPSAPPSARSIAFADPALPGDLLRSASATTASTSARRTGAKVDTPGALLRANAAARSASLSHVSLAGSGSAHFAAVATAALAEVGHSGQVKRPLEPAAPARTSSSKRSSNTSLSRGSNSSSSSRWACSVCTFENHRSMPNCEMCEMPRADESTSQLNSDKKEKKDKKDKKDRKEKRNKKHPSGSSSRAGSLDIDDAQLGAQMDDDDDNDDNVDYTATVAAATGAAVPPSSLAAAFAAAGVTPSLCVAPADASTATTAATLARVPVSLRALSSARARAAWTSPAALRAREALYPADPALAVARIQEVVQTRTHAQALAACRDVAGTDSGADNTLDGSAHGASGTYTAHASTGAGAGAGAGAGSSSYDFSVAAIIARALNGIEHTAEPATPLPTPGPGDAPETAAAAGHSLYRKRPNAAAAAGSADVDDSQGFSLAAPSGHSDIVYCLPSLTGPVLALSEAAAQRHPLRSRSILGPFTTAPLAPASDATAAAQRRAAGDAGFVAGPAIPPAVITAPSGGAADGDGIDSAGAGDGDDGGAAAVWVHLVFPAELRHKLLTEDRWLTLGRKVLTNVQPAVIEERALPTPRAGDAGAHGSSDNSGNSHNRALMRALEASSRSFDNDDAFEKLSKLPVRRGGWGDAAVDADAGPRVRQVPLFGPWQTEPLESADVLQAAREAAVADGTETGVRSSVSVIARNRWGNVSVNPDTGAGVPPGCEYIAHTSGEKIAEQLGLDYARAVTGFRRPFSGAPAEPRFGGVVVTRRDADVLRDALAAADAAAEARAAAAVRARALRQWGQLIRAVDARRQLLRDTAQVADQETRAEANRLAAEALEARIAREAAVAGPGQRHTGNDDGDDDEFGSNHDDDDGDDGDEHGADDEDRQRYGYGSWA